MDKAHDPNMKTSRPDKRYPQPYYPYYNQELHRVDPPPQPRTFREPLNRYSHPIYDLDKDPYYGPPEQYRVYKKPDIGLNIVNIF